MLLRVKDDVVVSVNTCKMLHCFTHIGKSIKIYLSSSLPPSTEYMQMSVHKKLVLAQY